MFDDARKAHLFCQKWGWSNLYYQSNNDSCRTESVGGGAARFVRVSSIDCTGNSTWEYLTTHIFVVLPDIMLIPLLSCKWWLNDKQSWYNMYTQGSLTFLPLAPSYLSCFPLPPCFFFFLAWPFLLSRSCYGSLRSVYLSFFALKSYLVFTYSLTAEPLGNRHSFPFLSEPVTPADTCAFVLLPPTIPPPSTHWLGVVGTHACGYVTIHCFIDHSLRTR